MAHDQEGVIKYQLQFRRGPAPDEVLIRELNAWRCILYRLGMIGRDNARYDGNGYGNVSHRCQPGSNQFVISGTQTAHIARTSAVHYVRVTECEPFANRLSAQGPVKPSSEALTHAAVYQADADIQFVFHVHHPLIWNNAAHLHIPGSADKITYGTPQMAEQIQQLVRDRQANEGALLKMTGHQDGIISFAATAVQAGTLLVDYLARALQL